MGHSSRLLACVRAVCIWLPSRLFPPAPTYHPTHQTNAYMHACVHARTHTRTTPQSKLASSSPFQGSIQFGCFAGLPVMPYEVAISVVGVALLLSLNIGVLRKVPRVPRDLFLGLVRPSVRRAR
jgi:hypothetical protein